MTTTLRFALLLAALSVCSGCLSFGVSYEGNPIDQAAVAKIVKGRTTRAEVLELLGAPKRIEEANITNLVEQSLARYQGEKLTLQIDPALFNDVYIYERKQTDTFVLFLIVFNYYSSDETATRLAVFFDKNGKVLGVGWTHKPE